MSDAPIAISRLSTATRAEDRARAQRLVAAWIAGTATPPGDDLRIEPLGSTESSPPPPPLCFCSGTFCWPATVTAERHLPHAHLE